MMPPTRKSNAKKSPQFKADVMRAVLKGDKPIAEIARDFDINRSSVFEWRKQLADNLETFFSAPPKVEAETKQVTEKTDKRKRSTLSKLVNAIASEILTDGLNKEEKSEPLFSNNSEFLFSELLAFLKDYEHEYSALQHLFAKVCHRRNISFSETGKAVSDIKRLVLCSDFGLEIENITEKTIRSHITALPESKKKLPRKRKPQVKKSNQRF